MPNIPSAENKTTEDLVQQSVQVLLSGDFNAAKTIFEEACKKEEDAGRNPEKNKSLVALIKVLATADILSEQEKATSEK